MNYPIITPPKTIENNVIDITDKLLQVTPMQYKMTPWIIKKMVRAHVALVTLPLYFIIALFGQEGSD